LLLGDGPADDHTSLYGVLKVQLAHDLVSQLDAAEVQLDAGINAMINRWKTSPSEYVRRVGWGVEASLP
jgi:hypothetical protein